jgi:hypothetical protein
MWQLYHSGAGKFSLCKNEEGRKFFLFALLFTLSTYVWAQHARVQATIDRSVIKMGEQATIELKVEYKKGKAARIVFPVMADTLTDKVEIVEYSKVDTIALKTTSDKGWDEVAFIPCLLFFLLSIGIP